MPDVPLKVGDRSENRTRQHRPSILSQFFQGISAAATPALWLGLLTLCGGMAVTAYIWLSSIPPLPDCKKVAPLAPDAERLYCAERDARSGKVDAILAGFNLVKNWSANHPLHHRVNRAMKEWSRSLLETAQEKAEKGDLQAAIELARKIPAESPIHKEVKAAIAGWQKNRNQRAAIKKAFQAALTRQDWQTAEDKILAFSRLGIDEKGRAEVKRLRQQLAKEQAAWEQFQQLQAMVEYDPSNSDTLAEAIAKAEQIDSRTHTHAVAKSSITRWTQSLLNLVATRADQFDQAGAIAAAQALPFEVSPPAKIRDLVWYSRAKALATRPSLGEPLAVQLQRVWMTQFHLQQIGKNSPFYSQAQAVIPQLEKQLQDLNQLQVANSAARVGQIPSLQLAIQIAQGIEPDRPQRLQAQSLIARWKQDIQRVADRPALLAAQNLAADNTIPSLKAAIAQASVIAPGRALRSKAQAAISKWNRQIQIIEDRPILDQAKTLASQKKLKAAIQQASKIRPERALYGEAQKFAQKWTNLIQIAEDQPILSRAKSQAANGNLSGAINTASQIGSGRALFDEAQRSISDWSAQIEAANRPLRRHSPRYRQNAYPPPAYASAPPPYLGRPMLPPRMHPFPELPPP